MPIDLAELLAGEDRSFGGNALYIDLVPNTAFYKNARQALSRRRWDEISRFVRTRTDRCEACGVAYPFREREAHERWDYNEETGIQRLARLLSVCKPCHEATHFGRALLHGHEGRAIAHIARVNRWDLPSVDAHIDEAFNIWRRRNQISWSQDLSLVSPMSIATAEALA